MPQFRVFKFDANYWSKGFFFHCAGLDSLQYGIYTHCNLKLSGLPNFNEIEELKGVEHLYFQNSNLDTIQGLPQNLKSISLETAVPTVLHEQCFQSENMYRLLDTSLTTVQKADLKQPPPQVILLFQILVNLCSLDNANEIIN